MSELIKREDAIEAMAELQGIAQSKAELTGISKAWKRIKVLHTVDAVPVVRGEWKLIESELPWIEYRCSECGTYSKYATHYCPNCGSEDIERTEESDTANGWKKAWKELPDDGKNYLVITAFGNIAVLPYNKKHQAFNVTDDYTDAEIKVLYWMPLPPMPQQKKRPAYDFQRDADLIKKAMELKEEDK